MSQGSDPGCTTMTRTGASPPNSEVHVQAHVQDVQQIAKQQDPPPPPATKSAAANDQIRFYQKVKVVGKGNFAKVYRGFHTRTKDAVRLGIDFIIWQAVTVYCYQCYYYLGFVRGCTCPVLLMQVLCV